MAITLDNQILQSLELLTMQSYHLQIGHQQISRSKNDVHYVQFKTVVVCSRCAVKHWMVTYQAVSITFQCRIQILR